MFTNREKVKIFEAKDISARINNKEGAQYYHEGQKVWKVIADDNADLVAEKTKQDAKTKVTNDKFTGVKYTEGGKDYMCSATSEDQHGLTAVYVSLSGGISSGTNFYFENGTVLNLNVNNMAAFQAVWLPFRQAFFK